MNTAFLGQQLLFQIQGCMQEMHYIIGLKHT